MFTSRMWREGALVTLAIAVLAGTSGRAQGQVAWQNLTFEQALVEAKKTGQLILVDVWSDHCGQCSLMDQEIWSTAEGELVAKDMIPIKIDSASSSASVFKRDYPVTGLPAIIVIDSDGQEIDRVSGYMNKDEFLNEAAVLRSGVDPIPDLEASVAKAPTNSVLMVELLSKYLNRKREKDAEALLARILAADPKNAAKQSEKALGEIGRYYSYFRQDLVKSDGYWRQIVERFPTASSVGAGIKSTYENAQARGDISAWIEWVCGVTKANPEAGGLHYSVATWANRGGLRGKCLGDAARTAYRLKVGPAYMDSLANVLEGK